MPLPTATIRTQLDLSLRFADGYATTARVFTFDGLVEGREHLAFGLGHCGPQMREAVERIAVAGGFLLYLRQEGQSSSSIS